jgi:hypothetical protein
MGDCHIYEDHIEPMKEQMEREPYEFPRVTIPISVALALAKRDVPSKSSTTNGGILSSQLGSIITEE